MVDRHCPFLNRDDPRCAAHFQVNHLDHAFEHCAGAYASCASYRELLAERIMARTAEQDESRQVSLSVGGKRYDVERRIPQVANACLTIARSRAWSVTARGLVAATAAAA